jgi:hypothetical protein
MKIVGTRGIILASALALAMTAVSVLVPLALIWEKGWEWALRCHLASVDGTTIVQECYLTPEHRIVCFRERFAEGAPPRGPDVQQLWEGAYQANRAGRPNQDACYIVIDLCIANETLTGPVQPT